MWDWVSLYVFVYALMDECVQVYVGACVHEKVCAVCECLCVRVCVRLCTVCAHV